MLIPGKLYKSLGPYTYTGPAIRNPKNEQLWILPITSGKQVKKDELILCIYQFTAEWNYRFPGESLGVFLYDGDYHILYERYVSKV